jgi:hypothetical protein
MEKRPAVQFEKWVQAPMPPLKSSNLLHFSGYIYFVKPARRPALEGDVTAFSNAANSNPIPVAANRCYIHISLHHYFRHHMLIT